MNKLVRLKAGQKHIGLRATAWQPSDPVERHGEWRAQTGTNHLAREIEIRATFGCSGLVIV